MYYNILVDDERRVADVHRLMGTNYLYSGLIPVHIVETYDEFVHLVNLLGIPSNGIISLDNDLGEEKEGYDCLKWLIDKCMDEDTKLPKIMIHSQNPVACENMHALIRNYKKHVECNYLSRIKDDSTTSNNTSSTGPSSTVVNRRSLTSLLRRFVRKTSN